MAEWRYIAARLNGDGTSTIIDPDLPLISPSFTKVLSGPAGMSATIRPAVARLIGGDGEPIIDPWSTAVFAEEDGVIRHGSIISNIGKSGSELSLTGVGFTAAIKDQPYIGSQFFIDTDPLDIARHIWDHWQSQERGDLGLILDRDTKTGKKVGTKLTQVEFDTQNGPVSFEAGPYKLADYLTDDLGGNFDKLATDHGFDYAESHSWNAAGDDFVHHLDFGYPRIGRRRGDLRFAVGENVIVQPTEDTPADAYASGILVRGAGDGPTMKRIYIPRAGETRLRRIHVHSDNTLKSVKAVTDRGSSLLALLTGRADIAEIQVRDTPLAPLGSWVEGDEVELFTDTDWGDGSMMLRILSTTIEPESPNVAKLSVLRADKIPS